MDKAKHRRPFVSSLVILEIAYAFLKIDARVSRFLREKVDAAKAADLLGATYASDETLARRLPGWIDASERQIKASEVRAVIADYRAGPLARKENWLRRKGFVEKAPGVLARPLEGEPASVLFLNFAAGAPRASLVRGSAIPWTATLDSLTMLQIGALMDARDGATLLAALAEGGRDLAPAEIMARVGRSEAYKKEPIPVVAD